MNRLKDVVYDVIGWLAGVGPRRPGMNKKLLIVRVDEIGDYMLWRAFLKEIVTAEKYKGYEFHFCGNKSWKSLFDTFDGELVQQSFWIDKIRFKKEMGYRYHFLKDISRQQYDVVINPAFSRDKRYDDSIVKATGASETIGMVANLESVRAYESGYDKDLYTQLFDPSKKPAFEFFRNQLFTEFVTVHISLLKNTKVDANRLSSLSIPLPGKYFVVFPGSRSKSRIWPTESFIRVSNHLFENYGWTAVIAGTNADKEYTDAFASQYKHPFVDLTGKTSLTEMLSLLKDAQCLLSVDTGSIHLAAAVGCTVFGIFNGSQYGRFAPYPSEIANNIYAIYPDDVEKELKDPELVKKKYEFVVSVPYDTVKPEKVILAIHHHYSETSLDHGPWTMDH
ncbi:MAG: glycosyltransferase family 9 protein [Sediminibacterium sp.]